MVKFLCCILGRLQEKLREERNSVVDDLQERFMAEVSASDKQILAQHKHINKLKEKVNIQSKNPYFPKLQYLFTLICRT